MRYPGSITDINCITVGNCEDTVGKTGCTFVLFDHIMKCGVDVRGGASGTLNTDILAPCTGGGLLDGVMLAGGSAFGLYCAAGAVEWLEKQGRGFKTGIKNVPLISGAVIYDLGVGDCNARPTSQMAFHACETASRTLREGQVGGGYAATVGKILQDKSMEPGGLGTACVDLGDGLKVAAIVVVNALGDVYDGETRLAGAHNVDGKPISTLKMMVEGERANFFVQNTTIGLVATNLRMDRGMVNKLAMMAHDGYAMAIRPVHTLADGDTVFSVTTDEIDAPEQLNRVVCAAGEAMRRAITNAVRR